jgi:hypothetical protein
MSYCSNSLKKINWAIGPDNGVLPVRGLSGSDYPVYDIFIERGGKKAGIGTGRETSKLPGRLKAEKGRNKIIVNIQPFFR